MKRAALLPALLAMALAAAAEEPTSPRPAAASQAWIEALPLVSFREPAQVFRLSGAGETAVLAGKGEIWLVCSGARERARGCRKALLPDGAVLAVPDDPGVPVRGRLVAGREPVAGARVSVTPVGIDARRNVSMALELEEGELVREVKSAGDGSFSLPPLAAGEYWIEVRAPWGRTYDELTASVPTRQQLRAQREPVVDLGEIALDRGLALAFFIGDDRGVPLAGARLGMAQGRLAAGEDLLGVSGFTDRDGRGSVASLEPGRPIAVTCSAAGHLPQELAYEVPPDLVSCSLARLARLTGRVVDEEGEPLPGAMATVTGRKAQGAAGADGRFELAGLAPGSYRLTVAAPGREVAERTVALAPGDARDLGEISLEPGAALAGRVVDATAGTPVAGATLVTVEPPGAAAPATTDAEGAFTLEAGRGRPLALEVSAAGYPATRIEVPPAAFEADEPFRVKLGRAGYVRVVAWDEEADTSCAGCSFSLVGPSDVSLLHTDAGGELLSPPLAPGEYQIYAEEVRNQGSGITVRVGDNIRRAQVRPGETVTVRFGEPKPRLTVRLSPAPPPGWKVSAQGPRGTRLYAPDATGTVQVLRSEGESLDLRLSGQNVTVPLAKIPADVRERDLDLELPRTQVRGRLVRGEQGLEGRHVRLVSVADQAVGAWTMTSAGGTFDVPFLPAGVYVLLLDDRRLLEVPIEPGAVVELGDLRADEEPVAKASS